MKKHLKIAIGIITGIIFATSLTLECYLVDGKPSFGSFGLIALLLGWLNFDSIGLIWLANPLFIISLILFLFSENSKLALILSLIASILAISFTQIEEIVKNEGGFTGQVTEYLSGYWLWITANILLLLALITKNLSKS